MTDAPRHPLVWTLRAFDLLREYARRNASFTLDEVRAWSYARGLEPENIWSAVLQRARSKAFRIVAPTKQYRILTTPFAKPSVFLVWNSLIYENPVN